jgi:hypothetical protein
MQRSIAWLLLRYRKAKKMTANSDTVTLGAQTSGEDTRPMKHVLELRRLLTRFSVPLIPDTHRLTAAIVLWNTVYLQRATDAIRGNGQPLDDTLLQYLSPLGWEHINLTGDYHWSRSTPKAGKFRPLRPPSPP